MKYHKIIERTTWAIRIYREKIS